MSDITLRVKKIIINKLGVKESEITPEANFKNDLSADSLETLELIMEFENEFTIGITEDQAKKIITVSDAIRFFEENVK